MYPLWQQQLHEAYRAKHQLVTQQLPSVVLYSNGQGTKSVTYTRTNLSQLDGHIAELERKLGMRRRRAISVRF